jgi:hypothetical protein
MSRLRDSRMLAGIFFLLVGCIVVVTAQGYTLGNLRRMGPGYFPTLAGSALMLIGLALAVQATVARAAQPAHRLVLRPLAYIGAAIVFFAVALKPIGLFPTAVVLVAIASLAQPGARAGPVVVLAVAVAALSSALFVWGLQLQLPVWPAWN